MKQMVNGSKRILCLLLAVCMLFSLLDVTVLAEQTEELPNPPAVEEVEGVPAETEEPAETTEETDAEAVLVTEGIEEEAVDVTEVIPEAAETQEEQSEETEESVSEEVDETAEAEETVAEEPVPLSEPDIMPLAAGDYDHIPTAITPKTQVVGAEVKAYTYGGAAWQYAGNAIPLSECLYTFHSQSGKTKPESGTYGPNDYIITCAVGSEWNRGYLHLVDDGIPTRTDVTTPQVITVGHVDGSTVGDFTFSHNGGHTLVYSQWNVLSKLGGDTRENQKYFRLYRPAKSGDTDETDIPGYVRITNLNEITNGGQYLIIKEQTRHTNQTDYCGTLFAVHPSASRNNKNDHVVRVDTTENYAYPKPTTTESVILTAEKKNTENDEVIKEGSTYSARILDEYIANGTAFDCPRTEFEQDKSQESYFTASIVQNEDNNTKEINDGYVRLYDGQNYNGDAHLLEECLYTFTNGGGDKGWSISANNKVGTPVFLNFNANSDGVVQKTVLEDNVKVVLEKVPADTIDHEVGDFRIKCTTNGNEEYLWFSRWNIYKFFPESSGMHNSYFRLYRPVKDEEASSMEVPGYVRVTTMPTSGEKYLIVKYQNQHDSTCYGQYFALYPTTELKSTARNSHVARITPKIARFVTEVRFTGLESTSMLQSQAVNGVQIPAGTIPMKIGSVQYDVQVFSTIAPTVTPYNTVFIRTNYTTGEPIKFNKDGDGVEKVVPVSLLTISDKLSYGLAVYAPSAMTTWTSEEKQKYTDSESFTFENKTQYLTGSSYGANETYKINWYSTNPQVLKVEPITDGSEADSGTFVGGASSVKITGVSQGLASIGVYVKRTDALSDEEDIFTYSLPVVVLTSSSAQSVRTLDTHVWRVEDTTPYYSLNSGADLTKMQLYEATYVTSNANENWALNYFGSPKEGYALTDLSNVNGGDLRQYYPIEGDREPSATSYYNKSGAVSKQITMFGQENVEKMLSSAMELGCEGGAGYTISTTQLYMSFVSKQLPRYAKELHGLKHRLTDTELADTATYKQIPVQGTDEKEFLLYQKVEDGSGVHCAAGTYICNNDGSLEPNASGVDLEEGNYNWLKEERVVKETSGTYLYYTYEYDRMAAREVSIGDEIYFKVFLKTYDTEEGQKIDYKNVTLTDQLAGAYFLDGDPLPADMPKKYKVRAQDEDLSPATQPTDTLAGQTSGDWSGYLDATSNATLRPSHANQVIANSSNQKLNQINLDADFNLRTKNTDEKTDRMVGRCYEFYIAYTVKKIDFNKVISNTLELDYSYQAGFSQGALNNSALAAAPNISVKDYTKANRIVGASLNVGSTLDINFYAYPLDKMGSSPLQPEESSRYFMIFQTEDGDEVRAHSEGDSVQMNVDADADSETVYPFTYHGVYAYQMPDEVTAYLCRYNSDAPSEWNDNTSEDYTVYGVRTYSVTAYAKRMLNQIDNNDAKLRSMLVDMLNYGTFAQRFARDNGWDKVSETDATDGVTDDMLKNGNKTLKNAEGSASEGGQEQPELQYYTVDNIRQIALDTVKNDLHTYVRSTSDNTEGENPPVHFDKVSLRLEEGMGMTLNATFTLKGVNMRDCTLYLRSSEAAALPTGTRTTVDDKHQVTVNKTPFKNQGAGTFAVEIKGVPNFFWGVPYDLVVQTNSGDYTLHYSVMSYCYEMMRDGDGITKEGWTEYLDELLKAMYVYQNSSKVWYDQPVTPVSPPAPAENNESSDPPAF